MPRIPVHTLDDAPATSRDTLAGVAERTGGKVLNIQGEMAHAPVVLAAYSGIQRAIIEHGNFDAKAKEAIALTVAAVDRCDYCQGAHTMSAKAAGWSEQQTVAIRAGRVDFDGRLTALLSVVAEAAGGVGYVEDTTWKAALEMGWTTEQLAEAFAHLAVNLYTNYFNHYANTDLDVPAAPAVDDSGDGRPNGSSRCKPLDQLDER